ncbi:DNA translocase FtsK 4TM domain-containing protein, partial [Patescibacteria group bacterium]|nr:DNA translocase FtsK 4TM domain-containing protein [Patescibacteria group bacterium]
MAKNGKNKSRQEKTFTKPKIKLKTETKHGIWAVIFFVLALFLFMSAFDIAGKAGKFAYEIFYFLLGYGYLLLPVLFVLLGSSFVKSERPNIGLTRTISGVAFLLSSLGLIDIASTEHAGGFLGKILSTPFVALFDIYVSIIFLGAILIISIIVMFDKKPELVPFLKYIWAKIWRKKITQPKVVGEYEEEDEEPGEVEEDEEEKTKSKSSKKTKESFNDGRGDSIESEEMPIKKRKGKIAGAYVPPPLSLLEEDKGKPNTGDIKANANIIKRTLANFGIEVEMDEITIGPTVTRYALKPAEGMKLSRIVGLQNDLALALAAHPLRIEAPIPGKSLVGIEIPNKSKSIVGLATMLADERFRNSPKPLTIALGRAISGKATFGNLAKMPHCLVAGTT